EAHDLAVLVRVGGHPVPRPRREARRGGLDDRVHPLRDRAIRLVHLGDLREHVALRLLLALGRLQLAGALPHRGAFFGRELLRALRRWFLRSHGQRSSWMRSRLPEGSRKEQSRMPYGCSVGSCTTSASPACSRSKVPSRSEVARLMLANVPLAII